MPLNRYGLLFFAVLAAGATACNPGQVTPLGRPECPTHQISLPYRDKSEALLVANQIGLSPHIATIPEFHDCQRLLTRGEDYAGYNLTGTVYGPLVAVIAAETLAVESAFDSITTTLGLGVATVYSFDGDYNDLEVHTFFNCLYFFKGSGQEPYAARMVRWIGEHCPATMNNETGAHLRVVRTPGQHAPGEVPPVARWDWNGINQYIGIKCGTEWCNVGRMSLWVAQNPKNPPSGSTPEVARTFSVKGYHDEELLAPATGHDWDHLSTPGPDVFVRPSQIRGVVVPVPGAGTIDQASFSERWEKVATAYLDGPPEEVAGYTAKYGFTRTPWESSQAGNEVALCQTHCPNLPDMTTSKSCSSAAATAFDENFKSSTTNASVWYARITAANGGGVKYLCVVRRVHPEFIGKMPSTARWRWLLDDQSIWVPCVFACCQVRGS